MVEYEDYRQITIADLPGLIEGAHRNIGMGHAFLKHVERTKLLLYIVDLGGFQLSPNHPRRTCVQNIFSLMKEIELYDSELLKRPSLLLLNKIDKDENKVLLEKLKDDLIDMENFRKDCPEEIQPTKIVQFEDVISISAKEKHYLTDVSQRIRQILDSEAEKLRLQQNAI